MARKSTTSNATWGRKAWKNLSLQLKDYRRALILTHAYPDPDALSSGWALADILRRKLKIRSRLAYSGTIDRPENRAMVKLLNIPCKEHTSLDYSGKPAILMVDASPGAGNNSLGPDDRITAVLDNHHGASVAGLGRRLRRQCGATATMATELYQAARLRPTTKMATALFYGIKTDTKALGREASAADEAAYRWLFPLADHRLLARIENPRLPQYTYRMLQRALEGTRLYDRVVVTDMGRLDGREGPATAVDLLVRLVGIEVALAHGYWNGAQVFSLRSMNPRREAWRLARLAVGNEGSAGGHTTSAGGNIPVDSVKASIRAGYRLERRFIKAARAGKKRGRKLV